MNRLLEIKNDSILLYETPKILLIEYLELIENI